MLLWEKIQRHVERKFQESGCTTFPDVRQVSRALGISQKTVKDEVEGCPTVNMMLTSYHCYPPEPLGDHSVETLNRTS